MVRELIKECDDILDIKLKWEMIKMSIRGESIKFGARKKKSDNNKLIVLQNKLYQIEQDKEKLPRDTEIKVFQDHDDQITLLQKDIEDIISNRSFASSFNNQVNWHADGEKPSKYFFKLENSPVTG